MNRTFRYCIILVILFFMGCETERVIFNGPYFVRFTEATGFAKESDTGIIEIEVHNGGPAPDEDVTINYSIGGSARENVDYTILDTRKRVTISAGEYFGIIRIQLINNSNNILRSQNIVLTLDGVTEGLQVGQGESGIGKIYTFTIFDDCILGGTYSGSTPGGPTYTGLTVTSTDCENYLLSDWNLSVFDANVTMDLNFIDNGDNTITIPQQEETTIVPERATISGSGSVNPITKEITLTIVLEDFEGKPKEEIRIKPQ